MKKIMILMGMCISTIGFTQNTDKYADFSNQKQSIALSTGINMKYIETGNMEGVPMILLHGYTDTSRSFQLMIDELPQINEDLRIIAPDLRGHGETSLPDKDACAAAPEQCFTIANFAADIIALMDQKNIQSAYIVGHSMGSMIAQEIALNYPQRVNKLILIGTFVNGKTNATIHEFLINGLIEGMWKTSLETQEGFNWPQDVYTLTPEDLGPEVTAFLRETWVDEIATDDAFLNAIHQETIRIPIGTWIGAIDVLGKVDNTEALQHLNVPALVLWATQDMQFLQSDQEAVKSALTTACNMHGIQAIFKTYGKTPLPESGYQENDFGHNLQWAAPKEVAADISSFIKNGFPVNNISCVNPDNLQQIRTDNENGNIIILGMDKGGH